MCLLWKCWSALNCWIHPFSQHSTNLFAERLRACQGCSYPEEITPGIPETVSCMSCLRTPQDTHALPRFSRGDGESQIAHWDWLSAPSLGSGTFGKGLLPLFISFPGHHTAVFGAFLSSRTSEQFPPLQQSYSSQQHSWTRHLSLSHKPCEGHCQKFRLRISTCIWHSRKPLFKHSQNQGELPQSREGGKQENSRHLRMLEVYTTSLTFLSRGQRRQALEMPPHFVTASPERPFSETIYFISSEPCHRCYTTDAPSHNETINSTLPITRDIHTDS